MIASAAPAWAEPKDKASTNQSISDKASELMNLGVAQYAKGNLDDARRAFLEAFELAPHHTIASNLAEVEIKLGRYREASEHLNYVLRSLPESATDERESAEKDLGRCRERVGVVRVAVSVAGASVTLDGKKLGTAPLETELWLDPGEYVVEARHAGYEPASQHVVAKAGESRDVTLSLGALPQPGHPNEERTDRHDAIQTDSGMEPKTIVLIGGGALTLASATVGTIFLLKSGAASDDADAAAAQIKKEQPVLWEKNKACLLEPSERSPACATLSKAQKDERTFKNVAIGGFIAAGAFAVGTITTYLLWPDKGSSPGAGAGPFGSRRRVMIAPLIDGTARGVTAEFLLP